jgi:hypothetical protein
VHRKLLLMTRQQIDVIMCPKKDFVVMVAAADIGFDTIFKTIMVRRRIGKMVLISEDYSNRGQVYGSCRWHSLYPRLYYFIMFSLCTRKIMAVAE